MVDCTSAQGNQGCNGGWYNSAWKYLKKNVLMPISSYPYTAGTTGVVIFSFLIFVNSEPLGLYVDMIGYVITNDHIDLRLENAPTEPVSIPLALLFVIRIFSNSTRRV